jgi:flagellar biosynthesis protein FliQ
MIGELGGLYVYAWETAAILALPIVGVVALVGVIVGLLQTVTGISDQNLSFGPKLGAAMLACVWGGPAAFAMLASLLRAAMKALPHLAR